MRGTLTYLFASDFRLLVKKEHLQARITVVDNKTNISFSQVLPVDHHLEDDRFKDCIKFCANKLIDKLTALKK